MKVIDLFCGAGGFSEGFKQEGFEVIAGVDNWVRALQSFKKNFPNAEVIYKDIEYLKVEKLPKFDILIGSPPCITWSKGKGKQTYETKLIKAFERLVIKIKPKYWIWENAPSSIKYNGIETYKSILNSYDFSTPQIRRRCFHSNFKLPVENSKGLSLNETFNWKENKVLCHNLTVGTSANSPFYLSNRPARTCVTWPIRIIKDGKVKSEFTVEMMKRVMGFPNDFEFVGNDKEKFIQIGNAVCPQVSKAIAKQIKLIEVNK